MNITKTNANRIQKTLFWFVFVCLFVMMSAFSDESQIINGNSDLVLPFINTKIERFAFVIFGPILIISLNFSIILLSNNLNFANDFELDRDDYIFLSCKKAAKVTTILLFYALGPVVLAILYWQYLPRPQSWILLLVFFIFIVLQIHLYFMRFVSSEEKSEIEVAFYSVLFVFVVSFSSLHFLRSIHTIRNPDLFRATLEDADMNGVGLPGVNISQSNLMRARLRGAHLPDADFGASCMNYANLIDAKLAESSFRGANLVRANFRGADLQRARFVEAQMTRVNLSAADLRDACLYKTVLDTASLRGSDLVNANLYRAVLIGEPFDDETDLRGAFLIGVTGLKCPALMMADNWQHAHRDVRLLCGASMPSEPPPTTRFVNCRNRPAEAQVSLATRPEADNTDDWDRSNYLDVQWKEPDDIIKQLGLHHSFRHVDQEPGREGEEFLLPDYLVKICTDSDDLESLLGLAAPRSQRSPVSQR